MKLTESIRYGWLAAVGSVVWLAILISMLFIANQHIPQVGSVPQTIAIIAALAIFTMFIGAMILLIEELIEWLHGHKQSIERKTEILKQIGIYLLFLALAIISTISIFIFALGVTIGIFPFIGLIAAAFSLSVIFILLDEFNTDSHVKYVDIIIISLILGAILGIEIGLIYIVPIMNISEYPISLHVFYPNHPNLTITQNCTTFTTTSSGYLNGQLIDPKNTTQCNLPSSMDPHALFNGLFGCDIVGKNITCSNWMIYANVTWKGTILNVSKR